MQWKWKDTQVPVEITSLADGGFRLQVGDWAVEVDEVRWEGPWLAFRQGATWHTLWVAETQEGVWVGTQGRVWFLEPSRGRPKRSGGPFGTGDGRLRAPVPAQVREIRVQEGERVSQGQVVVVLEAMKMEFRLQAPFPGVVKRVVASPGQVVEREAVVVELLPLEGERQHED